jgi:hypothetical protein
MIRLSIQPNWLLTLGLLILVLSSFACTTDSEDVAVVGEVTITSQDVAYRQAVVAVRSGETFPAHLALLQLIEEALMAEVGRKYGVVVSEEMLTEDAERVQETSRDPETLARIRAVFDDDETAYQRLVLAPILINQLLHARFSLGHDIQAEPLARAKELLAAAQLDPASMPDLAEYYGGEYSQLQIINGRLSSSEGLPEDVTSPGLEQYNLEFPDYDQQFFELVVVGLEAGDFYPEVVEDRSRFMVVRSLSRNGEDVMLETITIPKMAFDPWFQTQSQSVNIVIFDMALSDTLLSEVDVPYITDRLSEQQ